MYPTNICSNKMLKLFKISICTIYPFIGATVAHGEESVPQEPQGWRIKPQLLQDSIFQYEKAEKWQLAGCFILAVVG